MSRGLARGHGSGRWGLPGLQQRELRHVVELDQEGIERAARPRVEYFLPDADGTVDMLHPIRQTAVSSDVA